MKAELHDALAGALPELDVSAVARAEGLWLVDANGDAPPFRLLRSAGRGCLWHGERVAEVARDLDDAHAMLDEVERASGWRFEPADLMPLVAADAVRVADADTLLEIALDHVEAVPATLAAAAEAAPARRNRPRPTSLILSGPPLPVEDADQLAVGDLLLLPLPAPVRVVGHDQHSLMLDLTTGTMSATAWGAAPPPSAFGLRAEIALPLVALSLEALDAARAGHPIELGPLPASLPVEVAFAGRRVAHGVLVRLGDSFAVRLETLSPALEAAA